MCMKMSDKAYYEANKDRKAARDKSYRVDYKDKIAVTRKAYCEANKENIAACRKARYERNHDRIKIWREVHKDRTAKYGKVYRATDRGRELCRMKDQRRRARKANLPDTLTPKQRQDTWMLFNHRCAYCNRTESEIGKEFHQEHFIAQDNDGPYTQDNIIPACQRCNYSKHARDPYTWMKRHKGPLNPALAQWIADTQPRNEASIRQWQADQPR